MPKNNDHDVLLERMMRDGANPMDLLLTLFGSNNSGRVYQPSVDRTGDKIIIPEGAHLPDVIKSLQRQYDREEQETSIHVTLPVSPWDGAAALVKAIERDLGVVIQRGSADQIDVEVELGKTISIPWGLFELPGMSGAYVETDTNTENGRIVFQCHVTCRRRYEPRVRRLLDTVRDIATQESLHRGKAFSIAFRDEDGDLVRMPKPKFFEIADVEPIFQGTLTAAIERNIFVPIRHSDMLEEMGEPLKRGVLFAGNYGVGKTLLASHIAREATKAGWTFIYVKDSKELPEALRYAQQYQPVVIFAEDIDRVAGVERTDDVNELLNQLDGIDGKASKIMTIVTTNHPEKINSAMCRPGRIDLVLEVLPPDAETVGRMIQQFSNGTLDHGTDIAAASRILAGETPARIREVVGRAKLESLRRTGSADEKITGADLEAVAGEVKSEAAFFQKHVGAKHSGENHGVKALAEGFTTVAAVLKKSLNGSGEMVGHA